MRLSHKIRRFLSRKKQNVNIKKGILSVLKISIIKPNEVTVFTTDNEQSVN